MYLITSKHNDGSNALICKYKQLDLAVKEYWELKKRKYKNVHISETFKRYVSGKKR